MITLYAGEDILEIPLNWWSKFKGYVYENAGNYDNFWLLVEMIEGVYYEKDDLKELLNQIKKMEFNEELKELVTDIYEFSKKAYINNNILGVDIEPEGAVEEPETPTDAQKDSTVTSNTQGAFNAVTGAKKRPSDEIEGLTAIYRSIFGDDIKKADDIRKLQVRDLVDWAKRNIFHPKFDDLSRAESNKVKDLIAEAYEREYSIPVTVRYIQQEFPRINDLLSYEELYRIVRTEDTAMENKAREGAYKAYEKETGQEYLYRWAYIPDKRNGTVMYNGKEVMPCRELGDATKKGVPLDKLRKMVIDYSKKYYVNNPTKNMKYSREWATHPQCRCSIRRVGQMGEK